MCCYSCIVFPYSADVPVETCVAYGEVRFRTDIPVETCVAYGEVSLPRQLSERELEDAHIYDKPDRSTVTLGQQSRSDYENYI